MDNSTKETALTEAVINNDLETVKELMGLEEQVTAKNFLGFNGAEIAKYLGRLQCLKLLAPNSPIQFKLVPKDQKEVILLDEVEYDSFFQIRYLHHITFGGYGLFKEAVTHYSQMYKIRCDESDLLKRFQTEDVTPQLIDDHIGTPLEYTLRMLVYRNKIDASFVIPSRIEWIDDLLEYGLFADQDIKKGDFLGEYIGVITYSSPSVHRISGYSIQYPNYDPVRFDLDARLEGNQMRFANHSYKPNMVFKLAFDRGIIHPVFFANQDIPKGAQLTWNYGAEYWCDTDPPLDI